MVQPELWAAVALMLLGAAVSFCIKCQQSATKRETQLNEQRSQLHPSWTPAELSQLLEIYTWIRWFDFRLDSEQRFEVIRSHSTATRRLEKNKELENFSIARKYTEELSASYHSGYGSRDKSRYENFLSEDYLQEDAAYVEPISLGYYKNCTRLFTPPHDRTPGKREKDEDSYSYENVIIGASQGSDPDDAVDYENSMVIHTWKLQQGQATAPLTESPDDEPDYINAGPLSGPALLSEQSILYKV